MIRVLKTDSGAFVLSGSNFYLFPTHFKCDGFCFELFDRGNLIGVFHPSAGFTVKSLRKELTDAGLPQIDAAIANSSGEKMKGSFDVCPISKGIDDHLRALADAEKAALEASTMAESLIPEMVAHVLSGNDLNFESNSFGLRRITLDDLKSELLNNEIASFILDALHAEDASKAQGIYNKQIKMIAVDWVKDSVDLYKSPSNEFKTESGIAA